MNHYQKNSLEREITLLVYDWSKVRKEKDKQWKGAIVENIVTKDIVHLSKHPSKDCSFNQDQRAVLDVRTKRNARLRLMSIPIFFSGIVCWAKKPLKKEREHHPTTTCFHWLRYKFLSSITTSKKDCQLPHWQTDLSDPSTRSSQNYYFISISLILQPHMNSEWSLLIETTLIQNISWPILLHTLLLYMGCIWMWEDSTPKLRRNRSTESYLKGWNTFGCLFKLRCCM